MSEEVRRDAEIELAGALQRAIERLSDVCGDDVSSQVAEAIADGRLDAAAGLLCGSGFFAPDRVELLGALFRAIENRERFE